jgi:hypothetical protein
MCNIGKRCHDAADRITELEDQLEAAEAKLREVGELADKFRNGKIVPLDQAENTRRAYTPEECAAEIENLID